MAPRPASIPARCTKGTADTTPARPCHPSSCNVVFFFPFGWTTEWNLRGRRPHPTHTKLSLGPALPTGSPPRWWPAAADEGFAIPPSRLFERSDQRLLSPVKSTSNASAKLDFPDPLRPMMIVKPGPGRERRVFASVRCLGSLGRSATPDRPRRTCRAGLRAGAGALCRPSESLDGVAAVAGGEHEPAHGFEQPFRSEPIVDETRRSAFRHHLWRYVDQNGRGRARHHRPFSALAQVDRADEVTSRIRRTLDPGDPMACAGR